MSNFNKLGKYKFYIKVQECPITLYKASLNGKDWALYDKNHIQLTPFIYSALFYVKSVDCFIATKTKELTPYYYPSHSVLINLEGKVLTNTDKYTYINPYHMVVKNERITPFCLVKYKTPEYVKLGIISNTGLEIIPPILRSLFHNEFKQFMYPDYILLKIQIWGGERKEILIDYKDYSLAYLGEEDFQIKKLDCANCKGYNGKMLTNICCYFK